MKNTTKTQILEKTIEIIGKDGIHNITVRKIAASTGVNIAAINYHFSNKENLIESALNEFLNQITSRISSNFSKELNLEEMVNNLISIVDILYQHPGIIKSIYFSVIEDQSIFPMGEKMIKNAVKTISSKISESIPNLDINIIRINIIQTFSAILYPILIGDLTKTIYDIDYNNPEVRKKYLHVLVTKNFNYAVQYGKNNKIFSK